MTIESKLATVAPSVNGAHPAGKAAAGSSAGATGGQGFAGLVSALSAQDGEDVALVELTQPGIVPADKEENMPLALDRQAQDDTEFIASMVLQSAGLPSLAAAQVLPESDGALSALPVSLATSLPTFLPVHSPVLAPKTLTTAAQASVAPALSPLAATAQPQAAVVPTDPALPGPVLTADEGMAKPFVPASGQDPKSASASASQQTTQPTAVLQAQAKIVVLPLPVAELARPPADSNKSKSLTTPDAVDGLASAPGLFDRWGISPTYAVTQASAVVPDTQVAETVSYWVTHGVQKAELTLDGLGSESVEVHISVDGDQARVEFRTSQVDVRQAIEGAAGQLKSLLASEGLQLLGLSVGTSAKGNTPGNDRQSRPAVVRQASVLGVETIGLAPTRVASASVGQALDLYV